MRQNMIASDPSRSSGACALDNPSSTSAIKIVEAAGAAREIGLISGEALREEIQERLALHPPRLGADWPARRGVFESMLFRELPQVLEELRATAHAANVSFDELLWINCEAPRDRSDIGAGSANIVFTGGPDGPILGKINVSAAHALSRPACLRIVRRSGRLPVALLTPAGLLATADAMNGAGVALGHSTIGSDFEQSDSFAPLRLWAYEGLMRCHNTEQFIAHMISRPLRGAGYALVCVDAQGDAASLDAPCPLMQVRRPSAGDQRLYCSSAQRSTPPGEAFGGGGPSDMETMRRLLRNIERAPLAHSSCSMIALPHHRRFTVLQGKTGDESCRTIHLAADEPSTKATPASSTIWTRVRSDLTIDDQALRRAIENGCDWLRNISQVSTRALPPDTDDSKGYGYGSWRGAIRGEYSAARRRWSLFGPIWHTGQAVKALVLAAQTLGDASYLDAAEQGVGFILDKQIWDPSHPDHGLILAFEDHADQVNTSAVLEGLHGPMLLADEKKSARLWKHIEAAGRFLLQRMFLPDAGVFRDHYIPSTRSNGCARTFRTRHGLEGRPLLDDGILLKLYDHTSDKAFLDAHVRIAERLVADQNPPGNWIDYAPCHPDEGRFHPRHAYWWALPLIDTYERTGRIEFLNVALASGEFCLHAMRQDGGYFRGTYAGFTTDSFGHATSGSACAAILFLRLYESTRSISWLHAARKAIHFCMEMQFTEPEDANLRGAILEKVLAPDGTDRSPFYIRDLGTSFFIQAAVAYLRLK